MYGTHTPYYRASVEEGMDGVEACVCVMRRSGGAAQKEGGREGGREGEARIPVR
jgi:hypothetical protein